MDLSMNLSGVTENYGTSDPLPPGDYEVRIAGAEYRESTKGNGGYLRMQYKVVDGMHTGRSVFDNLNLWHTKDQTRLIAQSRLKAIAKVAHHPNPNFVRNTEELIGGSLKVHVNVKDGYNNVTTYKESELQPTAPSAAPQPQYQAPQTPPPPPPAAGGAGDTPWG